MFTMKHIIRPSYGEESEFCRPIGCYATKRHGSYFQFLAYDRRDTDTPDVWSGWSAETEIKEPVLASIYVMNEAGATVANFRYYMPAGEIEPMFQPEGPQQADPESLAA